MGNNESSSSNSRAYPSSSSSSLYKRKPVEEEDVRTDALIVGTAVAGAAAVAFGAWRLFSDSTTNDASDEEEENMVRSTYRVGRGGGLPFRQPRGNPLWNAYPYSSNSRVVKIMSYNIWFRDFKSKERMAEIGKLIEQHSPDLICLQEVTPYIYQIFQGSNLSNAYKFSVSPETAENRWHFCMLLSKLPVKEFRHQPLNSATGKELCTAEISVGGGKRLVLATSHLEKQSSYYHPYGTERINQANFILGQLENSPNVVFGGDMNWNEEVDGHFPLHPGWFDAWEKLRPKENGWTYDTKANRMLNGDRPVQKRFDRFICKLKDFEVRSIEMIGTEAIPGMWSSKDKRKGSMMVPILPSDHYGLLLTIRSQ